MILSYNMSSLHSYFLFWRKWLIFTDLGFIVFVMEISLIQAPLQFEKANCDKKDILHDF